MQRSRYADGPLIDPIVSGPPGPGLADDQEAQKTVLFTIQEYVPGDEESSRPVAVDLVGVLVLGTTEISVAGLSIQPAPPVARVPDGQEAGIFFTVVLSVAVWSDRYWMSPKVVYFTQTA
jgi:hypothetical protein